MTDLEYERRRELFRYLDIPNTDQANISRKWYGLRTMGWTEEQCELECRPKQINIEEELKSVREASRKEQKELAKYNREQAKLREEAGLYCVAGQLRGRQMRECNTYAQNGLCF